MFVRVTAVLVGLGAALDAALDRAGEGGIEIRMGMVVKGEEGRA